VANAPCRPADEAAAEELGEPLPLGGPEAGALEAASSTADNELAALLIAGAEVEAPAEEAAEPIGVGLTCAACLEAEHAASANAAAATIAVPARGVTRARRAARPRLGMPPC
jgi:hypothetical protein